MAVIPDRLFFHRPDRPVQVDGVPQYDGGRHESEATGPIVLVLETVVAHLTQAVEEHRSGQGVAGFPLVETGMYLAGEGIADPKGQPTSGNSPGPA